MSLSEAYVQDVENRLSQHSPALVEAFRESMTRLPAGLSEDRARTWAEEAVAISGHSVRSWEATADYLQVSPGMLDHLDDASLEMWASAGRDLAELASPIAGAYFRASPYVLPQLAGTQVREWATLGVGLYKATWKSISLASEFFNLSPALLNAVSMPDLARLARVLEGISDRSADLAAACLDATPGSSRVPGPPRACGLPRVRRLDLRLGVA